MCFGFSVNTSNADGSLRNVPYWIFTDWVEGKTGWPGGVGPIGADGSSSLLDFQLLWALQVAAKLESELGLPAYSKRISKESFDSFSKQFNAIIGTLIKNFMLIQKIKIVIRNMQIHWQYLPGYN